jgi:hypothetical protein
MESMSSQEMQSAQALSFSAKASGWGYSGSASGSYASNKGSDSTNQGSFEDNSAHSNILSRGGTPGSFGPTITGGDTDSAPMTWGTWAGTVDLSPWPIDPTFDLVENLMNKSWNFHKCPFDNGGTPCPVYQAWHKAVAKYLASLKQPPVATPYLLELEYNGIGINASLNSWYTVDLLVEKPNEKSNVVTVVGNNHVLMDKGITTWTGWTPAQDSASHRVQFQFEVGKHVAPWP